MKKELVINQLTKLIEPIVIEQNCELYHIEFVKEDEENYLRIYIDNPNGISLQDCEKVSRPVSNLLDIEDPIAESYYLEVSSPGIYRTLYNDTHLAKYIGSAITIKLSELFNGKKELIGHLSAFNEVEIKITSEESEVLVPRENIVSISLAGDI